MLWTISWAFLWDGLVRMLRSRTAQRMEAFVWGAFMCKCKCSRVTFISPGVPYYPYLTFSNSLGAIVVLTWKKRKIPHEQRRLLSPSVLVCQFTPTEMRVLWFWLEAHLYDLKTLVILVKQWKIHYIYTVQYIHCTKKKRDILAS